jgi:hypothetical protein
MSGAELDGLCIRDDAQEEGDPLIRGLLRE